MLRCAANLQTICAHCRAVRGLDANNAMTVVLLDSVAGSCVFGGGHRPQGRLLVSGRQNGRELGTAHKVARDRVLDTSD
jgi:hypothetical protein